MEIIISWIIIKHITWGNHCKISPVKDVNFSKVIVQNYIWGSSFQTNQISIKIRRNFVTHLECDKNLSSNENLTNLPEQSWGSEQPSAELLEKHTSKEQLKLYRLGPHTLDCPVNRMLLSLLSTLVFIVNVMQIEITTIIIQSEEWSSQ